MHENKIDIKRVLTYCRVQCPAARYDWTARTNVVQIRNPLDSTSNGSHTIATIHYTP